MEKLTSQTLRVIKTCNLYASCISSGIALAVVGPCLLEFQEIVQTDAEHRALIYTGRSIGYLIGSLLGGALFDLTEKKQFLLTMLNFLIAISMFAVSCSRTIVLLIGWFVFIGLSTGALDTGLNVCCLNLWGKDCGPFYQGLHFTYSFGSLLAPLIVAPFLGYHHHKTLINVTSIDFSININSSSYSHHKTLINGTSSYLNDTSLSMDFNINNNTYASEIPSLTYAYIIMGGYAFLVGISFLVACIIAPLDNGVNKGEANEIKQKSFSFVTIVVILASLLLFVEIGVEIGYAQMVATYSVKGPLHLTSVIGSYVTSAFWTSLTISRFCAIFLAIKYSSLVVIVLDLVVFFAGALVLQFLAVSNEWAFWLASIFIGFGSASLYASLVTWIERYITVTNKMSGLFASSVAFGEMVIPYVISCFLEKVPEVFCYVVTASCAFSILLTVILYLILITKQEKYVGNEGKSRIACVVDAAG